jgi:MFS transporter, FSR family, fosmidomycin resistance protein
MANLPSMEQNSLQRKTIFGVVCGAHFLNHFQSSMISVIYPLMMKDLGIGLVAIGSITAAYGMVSNVAQALYGFVVPYIRRAVILGAGNVLLGLSVFATGFASAYPHLLTTRILGGVGSSPQHPVGSTMLASYYQKARGRALAFHSTAGNLGSLVGPLLAAMAIGYLGWRGVFWMLGFLGILMGAIFFTFRDTLRPAAPDKPRSKLTPLGWSAYRKCLKNRNILIISLVFMVGAAGRGQGINETYIIPHFVNDLHVDLTYAAFLFTLIQMGGFFGPILWGWASDRFRRTRIIQISLLFSALSTLWLGWQQNISIALFSNLIFYGTVVTSRQTLTQALLSDIVDEDVLDAAFSLYYFIGFVSIPFWTLVTGGVMSKFGFGAAFTMISSSYLLGIGLLSLLDIRDKQDHLA